MLGGPGWSRTDVYKFLKTEIFVIPCGAVTKGSDPHGRIIHDYSYAPKNDFSINHAFNNSFQYISFVERAHALASVN